MRDGGGIEVVLSESEEIDDLEGDLKGEGNGRSKLCTCTVAGLELNPKTWRSSLVRIYLVSCILLLMT